MKWYLKAAEQGNATAQFNLGVMYGNGYGVEKNCWEASQWYTKAAEQGYPNAKERASEMFGAEIKSGSNGFLKSVNKELKNRKA